MAKRRDAGTAKRPGEGPFAPLTTSASYLKLLELHNEALWILKTLDKCDQRAKKLRQDIEKMVAEDVATRLEGRKLEKKGWV